MTKQTQDTLNDHTPRLNLKDFINKDESSHLTTTHVHIKSGSVLATDGHRLLVLKSFTSNADGTYTLDSKGKGEVLTKVNDEVNARVWDLYEGIRDRDYTLRRFEFHKILGRLKKPKTMRDVTPVYFNTQLWESKTELNEPDESEHEYTIKFNAYYLREFAGCELNASFAYRADGHAPMMISFKDADMVVMPMRIQ